MRSHLFILLLLFFSTKLYGLELPSENFSFRSYGGLIFFEDKKSELNENNVLQYIDKFRPHQLKVGNFGFTKNSVWSYLEIKSVSDRKIYVDVEYGFHDEVVFLHFIDGELKSKYSTGDLKVFSDRPLLTNGFAFPVSLEGDAKNEIVLKFKAQENLQIPFSIMSEKEFFKKAQRDQLYLGLLFGGIFALLLYNFFLWLATRETSYLTYSIYIFTHTLFQLSYTALGFQYIWSNFPEFHNYSIPLTGMINIATFTWFTRTYLSLSWKWELMDKILKYTGWVALSFVLIQPFISNQTMIVYLQSFHAVLPFLALIPVIKLILNKDRVALYYLTAFSFLMIFVVINVLAIFGLISYTEFLLRSPQIGFLIEGVLLSLGLAYRINLLETAKTKAEKEAIDNRIYKDLSKLSNQVSHDLQSPLAALHILGKDQNLSLDFKSMLQSTIDRITSIVSDLKIKSPDISIEIFEQTNLNKVVDEIIHEKSLEYSNRPDVKIKVSLPFFTLTHSINRSTFHRILSNMINNAIEAKSPTRGMIEVSIQLQKSEDTFRLLITDNGIGIRPELREEIFREGSSFGKEDGHGLGLYHAHKGLSKMSLNLRIVESNESGTVFEITPDKSHKS